MSALGHQQTFAPQQLMSALPPIADICSAPVHVRFVPIADIRSEWVFAAPRFDSETRLIDYLNMHSDWSGARHFKRWCFMPDRYSDEEVSRQILSIFMRHRIPASGTLQRNNFFDVRDADFQRGMNKAVANNWIRINPPNRYRYQLTAAGYAAGLMIDPVTHLV
jgi:hypothetical protein